MVLNFDWVQFSSPGFLFPCTELSQWPIQCREMPAREILGKSSVPEKKGWRKKECPLPAPPSPACRPPILCEAWCAVLQPRESKESWPGIVKLLSYWVNPTWNPPTSGLHVMWNSKYLLFKPLFTSVLLLATKLNVLCYIHLLYAHHSLFKVNSSVSTAGAWLACYLAEKDQESQLLDTSLWDIICWHL